MAPPLDSNRPELLANNDGTCREVLSVPVSLHDDTTQTKKEWADPTKETKALLRNGDTFWDLAGEKYGLHGLERMEAVKAILQRNHLGAIRKWVNGRFELVSDNYNAGQEYFLPRKDDIHQLALDFYRKINGHLPPGDQKGHQSHHPHTMTAHDKAVHDARVAAQHKAAKDQAAKDQAAKDQAAKDQAAKDQAAKDQAAKDQAAKDQAAKDQAAKDQAAKDQAAKDQAAKDQAAKDQAAQKVDVAEIVTDVVSATLAMELTSRLPFFKTVLPAEIGNFGANVSRFLGNTFLTGFFKTTGEGLRGNVHNWQDAETPFVDGAMLGITSTGLLAAGGGLSKGVSKLTGLALEGSDVLGYRIVTKNQNILTKLVSPLVRFTVPSIGMTVPSALVKHSDEDILSNLKDTAQDTLNDAKYATLAGLGTGVVADGMADAFTPSVRTRVVRPPEEPPVPPGPPPGGDPGAGAPPPGGDPAALAEQRWLSNEFTDTQRSNIIKTHRDATRTPGVTSTSSLSMILNWFDNEIDEAERNRILSLPPSP